MNTSSNNETVKRKPLTDEDLDTVVGGHGMLEFTETVGTNGDDVLQGGGENNDIRGLDGDDVITGNNGADYIHGGNDDDVINGQGGNDFLVGGDGDDVINGGEGNDFIYGDEAWGIGTEGGDDVINGGAGNDMINGGAGADAIEGGEGNDTITGGMNDGTDDVAYGGEGDDSYVWMISGGGNDVFEGGTGNDTVIVHNPEGSLGSLQTAYDSGLVSLQLVDDQGQPITITSDMWDQNGNLSFSSDVSGVLSNANGDTLTFSEVQSITVAFY